MELERSDTTKLYMKMRFKNYTVNSSLPMLRIIDREDFVPQIKVAEELDVNVSTVNVHFHKLYEEGLIKPVKRKSLSGRGRPAELWTIDKSRNFTVCAVFATPMLHMGLADFTSEVKLQDTIDCSEFKSIEQIYDAVDSFVKDALEIVEGVSGVIRYAYAGVPGSLEPETGQVRLAANMPILTGLDMERFFKERFNIPCFADSFVWGLYFGEMRTLPKNTTVAIVEWDLGVGILFGCGEKLFNFENLLPSNSYRELWDIGHTRIEANGRKCHCGKRGCLEAYVGGLSIIESVNDDKIKTLPQFISAIREGDERLASELKKAAYLLGKFIIYPIQFLGVERIIFTGLLSEVFDVYEDSFKSGLKEIFTEEEIEKLSPTPSTDRIGNLIAGSCEFARYVFLYPDKNRERRRISSALSIEKRAIS